MDSDIEVELDDLAFTGCDSFDLKLSGDELDLLLKLYIVHSLQRPPAKSQRPRQPLG